jgi:ATP10 protein
MGESTMNVSAAIRFPHLAARDLEGRSLELPDAFSGTSNLVIFAFRREQQTMVDSWVAWWETIAADHPSLRCYEIPVIATRWSLARPAIDGGMARAVRAQAARRRTLTVYTDVRRVTDALAIDDTDTVTVLLVDADGRLRWRTTGPVSEQSGSELRAAITAGACRDAGAAESLSIEQFEFAFDPQFRPFLALIGVTPATAYVTLTAETLVARFGPWTCETAIGNVRDVCRTGPYHWYKAIGPRGSFVDRGLTFGTTTRGGVCVLLREPVPGLAPVGSLRHPGITLTLAEPERFIASLRRRAGLV